MHSLHAVSRTDVDSHLSRRTWSKAYRCCKLIHVQVVFSPPVYPLSQPIQQCQKCSPTPRCNRQPWLGDFTVWWLLQARLGLSCSSSPGLRLNASRWVAIASSCSIDIPSRSRCNRSGGRDGFVMRSMIVTFYTFGVKTTVVMC